MKNILTISNERREWDSNPRSRFARDTHFPGVRLRPLGHLSSGKCVLTVFQVSKIQKKINSQNIIRKNRLF